MKRFTPHFSEAATLRGRLEESNKEIARVMAKNVILKQEVAALQCKLSRKEADYTNLINRVNTEAFRIKASSGCYTNCPIFKSPTPAKP